MVHDLPPIPSEAMDNPPFDDEQLAAQLAQLFPDAGEAPAADDEDAPPLARWVPTDEREAEWAMRKLAEAQAEIERRQLHLQGYIDEMQGWFERVTREPQRVARAMEAKLVLYALSERVENKRATIQLPSGVAKTTKTGGTVKVIDPHAVHAFLAEHLLADELALLSPPQDPKIAARELTKATKIVERLEPRQRCSGCEVYDDDPVGCSCPLGPTWEPSERVEKVAVLADLGYPVPGVIITPEGYSPKATPGATR